MHKCFKCGTEFDGKFCPNCGSKWEEEKVCPQCGANLPGEARFCTQCGYSFAEEKAKVAKKPKQETPQKVFSALRFLPFAALALFSVLLFAFFATPVASIVSSMVMGEGFPNMSLGNVYSMQSEILIDWLQLNGSLVSLIIFAVIALIYACAFGTVRFVRGYEFKRIKIAKFEISLASLLDYVSFILYLIIFIIAATVIGLLYSADDGRGILISGACPILLMVFSFIFALLAAGALVARLLLAKKYPELAREEKLRKERYIQAEKERKAQYYATHTAPVPPVMAGQPKKEYNRSAAIYRHDKRRYDKAKEGKTPAAVIWIELHKAAVLSVAAILLVAIILISVLVPIFTNKFRVSVVEKIDLGNSPEQVIKILGEPNETLSLYNDKCWQYYSDEYISLQQKIAKNIEKQAQAIEKGDKKTLLMLGDEKLKLEEQLQAVKYDFIEIEFTVTNVNELSVSSVFFEKNRCDSANKSAKIVEKFSIFTETFSQYNKLPYRTYFTDGSYYTAYAQPVVKDISGNSIGLIWSDKFNRYETYTNLSGYLIIDDACYINSNRLEIPSEDKNKITSLIFMDNVTTIGERAFSGCTNLTSITIPNDVTSIGESAFENCTNLESVYITDIAAWCNIDFLGNSAYTNPLYYAHNLYLNNQLVTNLEIPQGVTEINGVFSGCESLESITIPDSVTSIGSYAFYNCDNLESIIIPDSVTSIGGIAFRGCESLESITIPDSVTSIGYGAFYNCTSLTSIAIGNGVTSIGEDAFYGTAFYNDPNNWTYHVLYIGNYFIVAGNLILAGDWGSFEIREGTKLIADNAFSGCESLESIIIPDSVTSIGEDAFRGCTSLESITVTDNNTAYASKDGILYNKNKTKIIFVPEAIKGAVTIPDSVTSIGEDAFWNCYNLTSVTIGNSVTSIGCEAFYNCTSLTSITIPDSVTSIGYGAFYNCTSLTSIAIGNGVTSIGEDAFMGCTSLTSITIPDGVTSIGEAAFWNCYNLTSVTIGNSVTSIGNYAFDECTNLTSITIPDSVTSIGDYAFDGTAFYNDPNNWTNDVLYIGNYLIAAKNTLSDNYEIKEGTRLIAYGAFSGCTSLTSITIPDSVTSIGNNAFWNCYNLTSVTIGNSVTSIGCEAFRGCESLESVIFDNTNGWYCTEDSLETSGTPIPQDVQNPATAASYLEGIYKNYYWIRKTT